MEPQKPSCMSEQLVVIIFQNRMTDQYNIMDSSEQDGLFRTNSVLQDNDAFA